MSPKNSDATILIVDDVAANLNLLRLAIEPHGYRILVATNGPKAIHIAKTAQPDAILLDVMMPGMNGFEVCSALKDDPETEGILVIFVTAKDDRFGLAEGFGVGAVDYISKPFEPEEVVLRLDTHLSLRELRQDLESLVVELKKSNARLVSEIKTRKKLESSLAVADQQISRLTSQEAKKWGIDAFVGQSPEFENVINDVRKLQAIEKTSVLIAGESGTGKELVARAIHYGGPHSKGPFVAVNCSAITNDLAESAFFGHIKGSFSGAHASQKGYFEQADGGTLFLDEIGDMPINLQAKLLRALETNSIQPVGSNKPMTVQVRILAATNQNLKTLIARKEFRQDLFFRLSGYTLSLPPLRVRRDDILLLAQHFIGSLSSEMGRELGSLDEEVRTILMDYSFPGNVRELKNIVEHALIKSGNGIIRKEHLELFDHEQELLEIQPASDQQAERQVETWHRNRKTMIERSQGNLNRQKGSESSITPQLPHEERILEYLKTSETITNTECRDLLSVDPIQARHLLRKLCSYGLLSSEGDRRWRRYRLSPPGSRP